jgi:DNA repair protein RadC
MNSISEIQVSYNPVMEFDEKITSSEKAVEIFRSLWDNNTIQLYEEFKLMLLNRSNKVIGVYHLSKGGTSGTVVDVKILFAVAIKSNASGIIICHNHPSGGLKPSDADVKITNKIKKASELFEIQFLDHLIITKDGFYSFSNNFV